MPDSLNWHRPNRRPKTPAYYREFYLLLQIPFEKLGSLSAWHVVCPIETGCGIRPHKLRIVGRVREVSIIPHLACEIKWFGMLFSLIGRNLRESKNCRFSTIILRLFVPSMFISVPENFAVKTVFLISRVIWNNINLICELSRLPEIINKFTYVVFRPKHVVTLTTMFTINTQVIHHFTLGTHPPSTYEFRYMLNGPIVLFKVLCALRIKEYIYTPICQLARFQWIHVEICSEVSCNCKISWNIRVYYH